MNKRVTVLKGCSNCFHKRCGHGVCTHVQQHPSNLSSDQFQQSLCVCSHVTSITSFSTHLTDKLYVNHCYILTCSCEQCNACPNLSKRFTCSPSKSSPSDLTAPAYFLLSMFIKFSRINFILSCTLIQFTNRITCVIIVSVSWEQTLDHMISNCFGKWRNVYFGK